MSKSTPEITIKSLIPHGCEFVRDGKVLAEVYDPGLVRLLEHAPEMLAVCQKLLAFEQKCNDSLDDMMDFDALVEVTEMARAVFCENGK